MVDHQAKSTFRKSLVKWLQNIVAIAIVIWFIAYVWNNQDFLRQIANVGIEDAALLSVLIILTWFSASTQSYILFRASGAGIGYIESFILSTASTFGNYLPMRAGTLVRAHYMKSVHGLSYVNFGSVFSLRLVLTVIASGLIGLAATMYLAVVTDRLSIELLLFFLACTLIPFGVYLWNPAKSTATKGRIHGLWQRFTDGFHQLKNQPKTAALCLFAILAQNLLLALRFYIASKAVGMEIDLAIILTLVPLATLVSFTAITPGGIGMRESIMGYATYATGTQFSQGLFIGTIDRIMMLIMTAILGSVSFIWIWMRVNRSSKT
jgi:uncharacterized protein (TIRG00374 family)